MLRKVPRQSKPKLGDKCSALTTVSLFITTFLLVAGMISFGFMLYTNANRAADQPDDYCWVYLMAVSFLAGFLSLYLQVRRLVAGTIFPSPRPYAVWLKLDMVYRFLGAALLLAIWVVALSLSETTLQVGFMWVFTTLAVLHVVVFRNMVYKEGVALKSYLDQQSTQTSGARSQFRAFQERQLEHAARLWLCGSGGGPQLTAQEQQQQKKLYENRPIIKIDPASSQATEENEEEEEEDLP